MKLVLSRKGFDSAAGGVPSPILPDGTMVSLPIPDATSPIEYGHLKVWGHELGPLVADLTRGRTRPEHGAHLDPDLVPDAYPRVGDWRPIFGQAEAEQRVLEREGVGPGDLFLFFGWYRRAEFRGGTCRFVPGAPHLHVLWGWLQIDAVVSIGHAATPSWAAYHPHVARPEHRKRNALYVSRERFSWGGRPMRLPGAGVFPRFHPDLQLTAPGKSRSWWRLPPWFLPNPARRALGYHGDLHRWSQNGDHALLRTVGRGQEFVLDARLYPEAIDWAATLVERHGGARGT